MQAIVTSGRHSRLHVGLIEYHRAVDAPIFTIRKSVEAQFLLHFKGILD